MTPPIAGIRATTDRYEIAKEFADGMAHAVEMRSVPPNTSVHWGAGWKAGKEAKAERMNAYLVSLGLEPMAIVRLASISPSGTFEDGVRAAAELVRQFELNPADKSRGYLLDILAGRIIALQGKES